MEGLCRLCAVQCKESDPTVIEDENSEICQQLRMVCEVDIRLSDPLPKVVCGECVWMMETLFLFYTKVRKSQDSLEEIWMMSKSDLTTTTIKEEPTEGIELHSDENGAGLLQESQEFIDLKDGDREDAVENDASARESSSLEALSPPLSIVQEAMIIIPKKDKEMFEHENSIVKQEPEEFFYLNTEATVSPHCSSFVQKASVLVPREDIKNEDAESVELGVNEGKSNTDAMQEELLDLESGNEEDTHINEQNGDASHLYVLKKPSGKLSPNNKSQSNLSSHLKSHSKTSNTTSERRYKCSKCESAFTQNYKLKLHMRTHTGERPYKCSVCESAFTEKGHLQTHMRRHTGERPYKCAICESAFAHKVTLKIHMRQHTGERPCKCSVCGRSFARQDTLRIHMRHHTGERPYKCSLCESAFTALACLKSHMRQHTGERPYKCSVCNYASAQKTNLKIHMRQHTGEHPYKCSICDRAFIQQNTLKIHMRTHKI